MPLVLALLASPLAHASVARSGSAPDDGPAVEILLAESGSLAVDCRADTPRPTSAHVGFALATRDLEPGVVRVLGSQEAEGWDCREGGPCAIARGTVTIASLDDAGVRGAYALADRPNAWTGFDVPWCGAPVAAGRSRIPVRAPSELSGLDRTFVVARGTLTIDGEKVRLRAEGDPSDPGFPLELDATARHAVAGMRAPVLVGGQVRAGALHASSVRPAPQG